MSFSFDAFIDLVHFDQEIQKVSYEINNKLRELEAQKEQKEKLENDKNAFLSAVHSAQKEVHVQELEMKKLDSRETDLKKKLDDLANIKQYTAIKKELDLLRHEQLKQEDTLVATWNQLEVAQRNVSQKNDLIQADINKIDTNMMHLSEELEQLKSKLEDDKKARPEKTKLINEEWLERYEAMHGRVDNPVVEVVQGGCGGCFYPVPDQDLLRLRNRALLQCRSCYRFLYDPKAMQTHVAPV